MTQFLNDFDASMRFKLRQINERLVALERTIENCELSSGYLSSEVLNRGVAGNNFMSVDSGSIPFITSNSSKEREIGNVADTVDNHEAKHVLWECDEDFRDAANAVIGPTEIKKSLDAMGTGGGQSLEKLQPAEKEGVSATGGEGMEILDDEQNMSRSNSVAHIPTKHEGIGREMESSSTTNAGSIAKKRPPRPGAPPPRPGGQSMPENAPPLPIRPTKS